MLAPPFKYLRGAVSSSKSPSLNTSVCVCIPVLESIWKIFRIHTLAIGDVVMPMRGKYFDVIKGREAAIHSSPSGEKGLFKSSLRCFRWFYH